jgi:hypothetical protein
MLVESKKSLRAFAFAFWLSSIAAGRDDGHLRKIVRHHPPTILPTEWSQENQLMASRSRATVSRLLCTAYLDVT